MPMSFDYGERVNGWQGVVARVARASVAAGRNPATVRILAVSKTFPPEAIRPVHAAGARAFGENYVQEALAKIDALPDLPGLEWHLIGPLQSNKTRVVAERFAWVHTIDRPRIAARLGDARAGRPALNVCVQVNISGEATKSGVLPDELPELARAVAALPNLRLRGLMAIPEPQPDPALQRIPFARLRALAQQLIDGGIFIDTLSMGMSGDMQAAILEGASIVRVGSAIFGARHYE